MKIEVSIINYGIGWVPIINNGIGGVRGIHAK
jgi:hypothetical protein